MSELYNPEELELIACDVDDVLKHFRRGFVDYHNLEHQLTLTERMLPGYMELEHIIGADITFKDAVRIIRAVHDSGVSDNFEPRKDALEVLPRLAKSRHLGFVALTARQECYEIMTGNYLNRHFPDVFIGQYHTDLHPTDGSTPIEKYELCQELGIKAIIDDSPNTCEKAAANGMLAICFGEHEWNKHVPLQPNLISLPDWYAVEQFLSAKN